MKSSPIYILVLAFFINSLSAQQIGSWRLHFKYNDSNDIAYSESKLISATDEALLVYFFDDGSIRELDKAKGLSDIGVSDIAYCKDEGTFIVAYNSTNIDLISDNFSITNIPDIENKNTSVSKNINDIFIHNSKAFISSDLGLIILDIPNQEIDNTYIIGNNGDPVPVVDCVVFNDTIYTVTNGQGIRYAPMEGVNLLDYTNWQVNQLGLPTNSFDFIEIFHFTSFSF